MADGGERGARLHVCPFQFAMDGADFAFWTALSGFGLRSRVMVAMSVPGRSFHVPFGPMTLSPSLSEPKVTTRYAERRFPVPQKGKLDFFEKACDI